MIKYRIIIFLIALAQLSNSITASSESSFTPLIHLDEAIDEAKHISDEVQKAAVESVLASIREQIVNALSSNNDKAALDACYFLNGIIEEITIGCNAKLRHYIIIRVHAMLPEDLQPLTDN